MINAIKKTKYNHLNIVSQNTDTNSKVNVELLQLYSDLLKMEQLIHRVEKIIK